MNDVYGGKNGVLVLEGGGGAGEHIISMNDVYGGKNGVLVLEGGRGAGEHTNDVYGGMEVRMMCLCVMLVKGGGGGSDMINPGEHITSMNDVFTSNVLVVGIWLGIINY